MKNKYKVGQRVIVRCKYVSIDDTVIEEYEFVSKGDQYMCGVTKSLKCYISDHWTYLVAGDSFWIPEQYIYPYQPPSEEFDFDEFMQTNKHVEREPEAA